jgi:threonine aldolase
MTMTLIDLRSDTVTRPTPAMREAIAAAEVGDDVFGEDPTVNRLQELCAELTGHEAALFVPSGSMGNEVAISVHTRRGDEVITEADSHIVHYELSAMAAYAGVLPRPVASERGWLRVEQVSNAIRPHSYHLARTGLLVLENTHNMKGGSIYPPEQAKRLVQYAHERKIPVHLDGARVFNAAVALKTSVKELTQGFDSVMFCFSKGLGAPVGSMLVGRREFIDEARIVRKRMGGGMRQVGILAAACLHALEHHVERLREDHENASRLAKALAEFDEVRITPPQTNIVIFELQTMSAPEFVQTLRAKGVLALPVNERKVRMVTHLDVSREDITQAISIIRSVLSSP